MLFCWGGVFSIGSGYMVFSPGWKLIQLWIKDKWCRGLLFLGWGLLWWLRWGVSRLMKIYRNTGISPAWQNFVWRSRTRLDVSQRLSSIESALLWRECLLKCLFHMKYSAGSTSNWEKCKQIQHRQVRESHSKYRSPKSTSKFFLIFCYLSIY